MYVLCEPCESRLLCCGKAALSCACQQDAPTIVVVVACKVAYCWALQIYDISPASALTLVLNDMW